MANTLTPFNFGQSTIRTTTIGDAVWFVATDVAQALGYRNAPDASRHLDDDEKGTQIVRTLGGEQKLTIINESGLYALVLRSRKPEARKFAKWVTGEVLPAIRKTGTYQTQPTARHWHVVLTAEVVAQAIRNGEMSSQDIHTIATAANIGMMKASLALKRDGQYAELTKRTKQLSTFELGELACFAYSELLNRATKNKKGDV